MSAGVLLSNETPSAMLVIFATGAGEIAISIIFLIFVVLASILSNGRNQKWVVYRNGLPYCPNCNRQVSLKVSRLNCRACGYDLTRSPEKAIEDQEEALEDEKERIEDLKRAEERKHRAEQIRILQQEDRRKRRQEKEAKLKAQRCQNGGYTDYQLFGFGIAIVVVPVVLIALTTFIFYRR